MKLVFNWGPTALKRGITQFDTIADSLTEIIFEMRNISQGPKMLVLSGPGTSAILSGDKLTYAGNTLDGGTITKISYFGTVTRKKLLFSIEGKIKAVDLVDAAKSEQGGDNSALEDFFFDFDWVYNGTNKRDILPRNLTSEDGADINFDGDDKFVLKGGRDRVFADDGEDTLLGGNKNDTLIGARGDDVLKGQRGFDDHRGGPGDDKLIGGKGPDMLDGGPGKDTVIGGKGDDDLKGGARKDFFIFNRSSGDDTVRDYDPDEDVLTINGVDPADITVTDKARGALVEFDGESVLLIGVDASDVPV